MKKSSRITSLFKKQLILFALIAFSFVVNAQSPYYYTLNEESGLPSSEVYQIKQDKFGYIWIGTDAGLFRYDGIKFKQFSYSKENGRSIAGLRLDNKGQLWCQNFTGQIFRSEKDSLVLFKDFSKEMRVFPQFTIDKNDNVWVCGERFIKKFDIDGNLQAKIAGVTEKGDTIAWADIEINSKGEVLATAYNKGLALIVKKGKNYEVEWLSQNIDLVGRSNFEVVKDKMYAITENEQGKKYVISEITESHELKPFLPLFLGQFVYSISSDKDENMWVTTSNGVFPVVKSLNDIDLKKGILKGDKISCFFQDKEGNVWLSSLQNGIHVIPNQKLYLFDKENSALKDNYISCLSISSTKELLVGTYSGTIYKLNKETQFESFFNSKDVSYRSVKKVIPYKDGYLVSRGPFSYLSGNSEKIFFMKNARDFCVLNDTIYYTSSHSTGFIPGIDKMTTGSLKEEKSEVVLPKAGRSIVSDEKNRKVFFAANDGVYEYSNNKLNPILYNKERINANKLIFENNRLWIATINGGLLSFRSGVITNESEINSLLKGERIKTFKVFQNTIWVATESCLNKIEISTKTNQCFDLTDGLLSKEINDIALLDDHIYLATNTGLIKIPYNGKSINTVAPEIQITDVEVSDSIVALKNNQLIIAYNHNKLKIKFISSCLRARGKFSYKYRLLGFDSLWTTVSAINNQVIYSSLPSGEFIFQVKAINEDGVESKYAETLKIKVNKPFWQKWWFYILIALSSGLLVLFISVLVIKNIKKKAKVKNELVTSQLTAIRAQMNPHFMYNTLNSIQDLILKNEIKNTNYYLSKFSTLMRKILQFSEAEKIILEEEIEMLQDYLELEKLRFGNDFKFTFYISEDTDVYRTTIPSLIIQPFVENAIKHGLLHKKGSKELYIAFNKVKDSVVISIEDNGIGRKRSGEIKERSQLQHKSFAVSATQKRLELLNQEREKKIEIEIIDKYEGEVASGTLVKLHFPLT